VERAFAGLWSVAGESLPEDEHPEPKSIPQAGEEAARVVVQEPRRMRTLRMLQLLTAGVERRLWITDAYFLSMAILSQSLMSVARDGVDVRVLVPATNDLPWIGALSRTGYRQFLEAGVRIFEYGGPMIHAKTLVADGWWSKVGSTNLNVASLVAKWEIDLVAEDIGFAAQMEELFEEDLSNAREVLLAGSAAHPRVRPERPIQSSDRDARSGVVGSGSGGSATILRVGSTALQKSGYPLETHEQALAAAASGAMLGASLLSLRFPRFLAWPRSAPSTEASGRCVPSARPSLSRLGKPFPNPRLSARSGPAAFAFQHFSTTPASPGGLSVSKDLRKLNLLTSRLEQATC
jgi:cardiolipin synthase A/B